MKFKLLKLNTENIQFNTSKVYETPRVSVWITRIVSKSITNLAKKRANCEIFGIFNLKASVFVD